MVRENAEDRHQSRLRSQHLMTTEGGWYSGQGLAVRILLAWWITVSWERNAPHPEIQRVSFWKSYVSGFHGGWVQPGWSWPCWLKHNNGRNGSNNPGITPWLRFKGPVTLSKSVGVSLPHFLSLVNQDENEIIIIVTFYCLMNT